MGSNGRGQRSIPTTHYSRMVASIGCGGPARLPGIRHGCEESAMFRNLEIRWKLAALLVLPLLGLIVFASSQVHASASRQQRADRLNRLSALAVDVTGLTDALQQERATSSGYVAS